VIDIGEVGEEEGGAGGGKIFKNNFNKKQL
jgi:hypothetical protein